MDTVLSKLFDSIHNWRIKHYLKFVSKTSSVHPKTQLPYGVYGFWHREAILTTLLKNKLDPQAEIRVLISESNKQHYWESFVKQYTVRTVCSKNIFWIRKIPFPNEKIYFFVAIDDSIDGYGKTNEKLLSIFESRAINLRLIEWKKPKVWRTHDRWSRAYVPKCFVRYEFDVRIY